MAGASIAWAALSAAISLASAMAPTTVLSGRVSDATGTSIANALMYAVDEATGVTSGSTRSDQDGEFQLRIPARKHSIGLASAVLRVLAYEENPPGHVRIIVTADPEMLEAVVPAQALQGPEVKVDVAASPGPATAENPSPRERLPVAPASTVSLVRGQVRDETGAPLGGVRVVALDAARKQRAVAFTEHDGRYTLALPGGSFRIAAISGGLKMSAANRRSEADVDFVMAVDVAPQEVRITDQHVLRFRIEDSIWPEYLPPPQVRAWLSYAHGIDEIAYRTCPSFAHTTGDGGDAPVHCPPSVWVYSHKVQKFWWMRLLRRSPDIARTGGYRGPVTAPPLNAPPLGAVPTGAP